MIYQSFHELCEATARNETRYLTIRDDPVLPRGDYLFIEAYCNKARCDCRRVFFNVYHVETKEFHAVIAYGWENEDFYAKWMNDDDPETIRGLKGPCLNMMSPQSKFAPALLDKLSLILDEEYIKRLKRHYKMFKEAVRGKRSRGQAKGRKNRTRRGT